MDDQLQSLSKLFTEKLFRIPDYQRGYAWTKKNVLDFWNDIQRLPDGRNHYVGVLTLESVAEKLVESWKSENWMVKSKSFSPYYVVDGQQRLTTALILIAAVLEMAKKLGLEKLNFTRTDEIRQKFIYDSKDDGVSRTYVFGYEQDNPSYEFLKQRIFDEPSASPVRPQDNETVYTENLANALAIFREKLESASAKKLEKVYRKLTQHLLFNTYKISEDIDVFVTFETMNNRGKPLSTLELLKNRLIYLTMNLRADEHSQRALRVTINDCWKTIYHNLGRNKSAPLDDDVFLYLHYILYFANPENQKGHLARRVFFHSTPDPFGMHKDLLSNGLLEKEFSVARLRSRSKPLTALDTNAYVMSLRDSVEAWYYINNPDHSPYSKEEKAWMSKLRRLGHLDSAPLLLALYTKFSHSSQAELRINALTQMERIVFLYSLHSRYVSVDEEFSKLAINAWHQKTPSLPTLIRHLTTIGQYLAERKPDLYLGDGGWYRWHGIRYFMYEYNEHLSSRTKSEVRKMDWAELAVADSASIEHIYPQNPTDPYWESRFEHLSPKQRKLVCNSLGNLLPISRSKNSSLSNRSFREKVEGRPGDARFIGYRYGSLVENEVAAFDEWTPERILERGVALLDFMEERWAIDLGDDTEKTKLLSIEFLSDAIPDARKSIAAKKPAAKKPASKKPAAKKPASKKPASKKHPG